MTLLALSALTRHFGTTRAADGVDLAIGEGDIHALIGPSGCGKSTLLRLIAGFETPDSGEITMRGKAIGHLPPEARDIGIVFQDYALFPHLTVEANIGFGLHRLPRADRERRIRDHVAMLRLGGLEKRYPDELSGGQQQRVALARSLAAQPSLLLLDEPFSNLDASLREQARRDIRLLLKERNITVLFVTHDREEALSFADCLSVMNAGRLEQTGSPADVYARPRNAFIAGFLGPTNLLAGEAHGATATTVLGEIAITPAANGPVTLSLRPEALCFTASEGPVFHVTEHIFRGHDRTYVLQGQDGTLLQVHTTFAVEATPGDSVRLEPRAPATVVERSRFDTGS